MAEQKNPTQNAKKTVAKAKAATGKSAATEKSETPSPSAVAKKSTTRMAAKRVEKGENDITKLFPSRRVWPD